MTTSGATTISSCQSDIPNPELEDTPESSIEFASIGAIRTTAEKKRAENRHQRYAEKYRPQQCQIVWPQRCRRTEPLAPQCIVVGQVLTAGAGRHRGKHAEGQYTDDGPEQVHPRYTPILPVPVEADVSPGGHAGVESHRPIDDPGIDRNQRYRDDRLARRTHEAESDVDRDDRDGNQPSLQDRYAPGVVVQSVPEDDGIAKKVARSSDLGPCRVDAQSQNAEDGVGEPDPEILGRAAGEFDRRRSRCPLCRVVVVAPAFGWGDRGYLI